MSTIHNADCRMSSPKRGRPAEFFLEQYYTPDQIAIAFAVNKKTALNWIHTDSALKAAAIKDGPQLIRVPASALNDFIRRRTLTQEST